MSILDSICAEIQETGDIQGDKSRYRENTETAMSVNSEFTDIADMALISGIAGAKIIEIKAMRT